MASCVNMCARNSVSKFRLPLNLMKHYGWRLRFTSTASEQPDVSSTDQDSAQTKDKIHEQLEEDNKALLEQVKEIDDKYKRALAENENVRQRMTKQIEEAKKFGIQSFCRDLLDVADVLGKAVEAVPEDALKDDNQHLKNLYEGLKMTEAQLQSVFRRYGVTQLIPLGSRFDPNIHEALFELDDPTKETGTVAAVTKIGYKLHERTLRPALVGVVKSR